MIGQGCDILLISYGLTLIGSSIKFIPVKKFDSQKYQRILT